MSFQALFGRSRSKFYRMLLYAVPLAGCWWVIEGIVTNNNMSGTNSGQPCIECDKSPQSCAYANTCVRFNVGALAAVASVMLLVLIDYGLYAAEWSLAMRDVNDSMEAAMDTKRGLENIKICKEVHQRLNVKYFPYVVANLWYKFATELCRTWIASSALQYAMVMAFFAVMLSELLEHTRSVAGVLSSAKHFKEEFFRKQNDGFLDGSTRRNSRLSSLLRDDGQEAPDGGGAAAEEHNPLR